MRAILIDPESRLIEVFDFDGNDRSIPQVLGCERVAYEQWPISGSLTIGGSLVTRIYSDEKAVGNSAMHGFYVPHTAGIINHGRCLQLTFDTRRGAFSSCDADIDTLKRTYRIYVPGKGTYYEVTPPHGVPDEMTWK
jgi:hypothetical protein